LLWKLNSQCGFPPKPTELSIYFPIKYLLPPTILCKLAGDLNVIIN